MICESKMDTFACSLTDTVCFMVRYEFGPSEETPWLFFLVFYGVCDLPIFCERLKQNRHFLGSLAPVWPDSKLGR